MLDKIILGTANFTQQYGILSHSMIERSEVEAILETSCKSNILTLDTAFNYGNIFCDDLHNILGRFVINTKFSLLDDLDSVHKNLKNLSNYEVDTLMVHNPQNMGNIDKKELQYFFHRLIDDGLINRIGVSIYDEEDLYQFASLYINPDVVQIPLNPLHQKLNNNKFKNYILDRDIEIQARSLFMQGVLLSYAIPNQLTPIRNIIKSITDKLDSYGSRLTALLQWADQQGWVSKWVLGVSSTKELLEITHVINDTPPIDNIDFTGSDHILIDPRNWSNNE